MNQPSVLATLCELARNESGRAAKQLGQLQYARQQALQQQQLLTGYHQDYQRSLQQKITPGMPLHRWDDFQQFIPGLQRAIQQQQQILQQGEQPLSQAKIHWQQKKQRQNALQTLLERQQQRLRVEASRREQKQMDEFSARHFRGDTLCQG